MRNGTKVKPSTNALRDAKRRHLIYKNSFVLSAVDHSIYAVMMQVLCLKRVRVYFHTIFGIKTKIELIVVLPGVLAVEVVRGSSQRSAVRRSHSSLLGGREVAGRLGVARGAGLSFASFDWAKVELYLRNRGMYSKTPRLGPLYKTPFLFCIVPDFDIK